MFASNCFVASRDLLSPALLCDPHMSTAEDSFLILSLVEQCRPHFSMRLRVFMSMAVLISQISVNTLPGSKMIDASHTPRR